MEFELVDSRDQTRIVVHTLCSGEPPSSRSSSLKFTVCEDTSEYPDTHSFFSYSPEPGSYGEQMKEICNEMPNDTPSTILEVAKYFLAKISGDEDGEGGHSGCDEIGIDEDDVFVFGAEEVQPPIIAPQAVDGKSKHKDWVHNMDWVGRNIELLLPPPVDSTPGATMALQKEYKAIMKEQLHAEKSNAVVTLGWYMPPEFNGENLFQWVVEMHSFDPTLPLAKDMESR